MITWKQLAQAVLTGSATSLYTTPGQTTAAIHQATAWNPTAGVVTVKVMIGATAADSTTVWSINVPAGQPAQIPQIIGHKLQAGQQLFASGAGVTLTVSGAENVQ
jgi:hypothetical protein